MEKINHERPPETAGQRRNSSTVWKRLLTLLRMPQIDYQKLLQNVKRERDRILSRFKGDPKEEEVESIFLVVHGAMESLARSENWPKRTPKIFERKAVEDVLREVRSAIKDLHKVGFDDTAFLYDLQKALEERHAVLSGKSPGGVGFG